MFEGCKIHEDIFEIHLLSRYSFATNGGNILISGNSDRHWNCQRNANIKQLGDFLKRATPRQHAQERTQRGHIIDLITPRADDTLIRGVSMYSILSDHFLINLDVSFSWSYVISGNLYNSTLDMTRHIERQNK